MRRLAGGTGVDRAAAATRHLRADAELRASCAELLARLGLDELASRLMVGWNPRLQTTAGRAWCGDAVIELNPRLKEISEHEVERTMKHELAHLIAHERAGKRRIVAHGPEWRKACTDVGIPGEKASHDLPFAGRRMRKRFDYICPSCEEVIERVRKVKGHAACSPCCRLHNSGRYDDRFRLIERVLES